MFRFPALLRKFPAAAPAAYRKRSARTVSVWYFERFESRVLLSATALDQIVVQPTFAALDVSPSYISNTPTGLTPQQVQNAYGFNNVTFGNGAIKGDGSGQTIAIVTAYRDPNIASDLATFDAAFKIQAPPSFTVATPGGNVNSLPVDAGWAMETALDVEWAHAMAPNANILLVEANSNSLNSLMSAVNYARYQPGVSAVSMSWGSSEFSGETSWDSYFTTPAGHTPITFVAASGDNGAPAIWPAASPNVLSVGGTTLSTSGTAGTYLGETGWSGSGGGTSLYEYRPSYQSGVQSTSRRSVPDVAYDANPTTGFAVYDSTPYQNVQGWSRIGGTSAGAPQWSALVAIADQGRALSGKAGLNGAQATLYTLPSTDFHDITSGYNGYYAHSGYDYVTGRGSPLANLVVRDLVGTSGSTTVTRPMGVKTYYYVTTYSTSQPKAVSDSTAPALPGNAAVASQGPSLTLVSTVTPSAAATPASLVGLVSPTLGTPAESRLGSSASVLPETDRDGNDGESPARAALEQPHEHQLPAAHAVAPQAEQDHTTRDSEASDALAHRNLDAWFAVQPVADRPREAAVPLAPAELDEAEPISKSNLALAGFSALLAYCGLRYELRTNRPDPGCLPGLEARN